MPRQIRDVRLQTREARLKLAPAKEPYWREVRRGLHVGYYKGRETGTWWLREIREGRRAKRRVGLADDHVPADGMSVYSFEQVLKVALGEERPTLSPVFVALPTGFEPVLPPCRSCHANENAIGVPVKSHRLARIV